MDIQHDKLLSRFCFHNYILNTDKSVYRKEKIEWIAREIIGKVKTLHERDDFSRI